MIVTIIGWMTIVAIVAIIGFWIYSIICDKYNDWIMKVRYQGVKDLLSRINDAKYWLNSPEREPFQKFYEHILNDINYSGNVNAERLRVKVDEIIKETSHKKDEMLIEASLAYEIIHQAIFSDEKTKDTVLSKISNKYLTTIEFTPIPKGKILPFLKPIKP